MTVSSTSLFYGVPALSKENFNRLAGERDLPFLLTGKLDDTSKLRPEHLEFNDEDEKRFYVENGEFTPLFKKRYLHIIEMHRRATVAAALAESRTVRTVKDLSQLPADEKEMVKNLLKVSEKVERLFMKQQGSFQYIKEMKKKKEVDSNSYKLFWRNQGPWVTLAKFENNPFANALPTFDKHIVGIYPPDIEVTPEFQETLQKDKELSNQWTVVRKDLDGKLTAIPFHIYYQKEMEEIAAELDSSAAAIENNSEEKALYQYLKQAAIAFRNGDWDAADEKWVAMNMSNSKYAIRVAPDETYWDPANLKSGFEFWFALIDKAAASFSKKIDPYIQEMENHLHELVHAYEAKEVKFELPDFIEMLLVSGEHRAPVSAVIGQKLPNFNDKFSRMVVMTNYYTDDLSAQYSKEKAEQMFVDSIVKKYDLDGVISTTNTLLHEMTHSFGVRGATFEIKNEDGTTKLDESGKPIVSNVALGGHNSQVMEELKAQTGGVYWIGWLKEKNVISNEMAEKLYTDAILWAFGHISQGFKLSSGSPRTYSQLAGIQIDHFLKSGALTVEDGKFNIHYEKMHESAKELFKIVVGIQVYGDEKQATALRNNVSDVDAEGYKAIRAAEIKEIFAPYPRATFDLQVTL